MIIDLLDVAQEAQFQANPDALYAIVNGLPPHITHIVIDEIQKIPKLLDGVSFNAVFIFCPAQRKFSREKIFNPLFEKHVIA